MYLSDHSRVAKKLSGIAFVVLALSWPAIGQDVQTPGKMPRSDRHSEQAISTRSEEASYQKLIEQIAKSGRILEIAASAGDRISDASEIPPGVAPVLRFRVLEQQTRFRLGRLDLVVDDAGH